MIEVLGKLQGSGQAEILFHGRPVEICRKPRLRRLNLKVSPPGNIRVSTNLTLQLSQILKFLTRSESWILEKLKLFSETNETFLPKQFKPGELFLLRGNLYPLELVLTRSGQFDFALGKKHFWVGVPESIPQGEGFRRLVAKNFLPWFREQAIAAIKGSVGRWSQAMGLEAKSIGFRSQSTRWGSCSGAGHLSFNWKLWAAPPHCLDYVVVHELAHLKFLHHQPRFWHLVDQHFPEHRTARRWLKDHQNDFYFLDEIKQSLNDKKSDC